VARDGLLYLADSFFSLVHVYTYEGKWLRSFDVLFRDTLQSVDQDDRQARLVWREGFEHKLVDADCIVSMCGIGEENLAVGLEGGLIRLLNHEGGLIADILPHAPGLYPNSMVADSSENLFVYYSGDSNFNKPKGLYRYGADGKNKGPLLRGELGIFKPKQKDLEKKIAEDRAVAYGYFDLADLHIRRKKLSQETIGLLEKSLDLKPDFWIAWAYLGLSLKELGEIERAVACMEKAMEHMNCSVMATALIEFYYRKRDKERVMLYFKKMQEGEDEVDVDFYSEEITNKKLQRFLGPLVTKSRRGGLVCS
jgi:tetratricopeptide (TPR) repeat protein